MDETNKAPVDRSVTTAPALQNWTKAPTLMELKQDLSDAQPVHDAQILKIQTWLDNLNIEGKAKINPPKGSSAIQPKLIRKQAEWRYAALSEPFLSTQDVFNVAPVTWEDRDAARQNQMLLNYQLNTQIDKVKFVDEYVRTAVDEGTVVVKVNWEFEEEEIEVDEPEVEFRVNPELQPMHDQLHQMMEMSPSQYQTDVPQELKDAHELTMERGVPIEPIIVGQKKVKKMKTIVNRPTLEICDYRYVILDPTAKGDVEKAQFLVYQFPSSLAELQKDGRYKNLEYINVEGNSILSTPDTSVDQEQATFNFSDKPRKKIWVNEYWGFRDIDGSGKLTPIVAAWVGETLIRLDYNPFPDKKIPFVIEQYLPVRRSNYGEPDGALLEDNQKVVGAVTRGMVDLLGKSANSQTGMRKDMLDATNKRKFERGQDYEFNQNVDPRLGVHMHTYPEIPQSAQFMLALQNQEAESMTGVKSFSQGVSGASLGDVAAGVRGALDAASKRELGILRRLSNGVIKIGRKMIAMNAEFLNDEEVIRVTNEQFVKVRRDDLPGNFDLSLSISTAEEDNNKAEQLAFMFQTIGPKGDPGMTKMILSDIARLRKMPDLAERIENYEPQPDPLVQQEAQLRIELLRAQIAKVQSETIGNQASAQLDMAKVGTEGAKAQNLNSDADLKNLDFVEQESGVKQEREIQKGLKVMDQMTEEKKMKFDLVKEYVKAKSKPKSK
jgi:hypothetical protein